MRRAPIKRRSAAKQAEERERAKLRLALLDERGPMCEWCGVRPWTDMNERLSRGRGGSATDRHNILCLCRSCHTRAHLNPEWAESVRLLRHATPDEHAAIHRPWLGLK